MPSIESGNSPGGDTGDVNSYLTQFVKQLSDLPLQDQDSLLKMDTLSGEDQNGNAVQLHIVADSSSPQLSPIEEGENIQPVTVEDLIEHVSTNGAISGSLVHPETGKPLSNREAIIIFKKLLADALEERVLDSRRKTNSDIKKERDQDRKNLTKKHLADQLHYEIRIAQIQKEDREK